MSIVFFCTHCGARFEVAETAAGKTGRCKRCSQQIAVPQASAAVSAGADKGTKSVAAAESQAAGPSWLERIGSQVGLAPLTIERMPGPRKPVPKPTPLDDLGDSKPYALVEPKKQAAPYRGPAGAPAGEATIFWRRVWGVLQKFFRRVNEFAYLLSVPFLMLILIGATAQNRSLALLGAEAVVLLNIGRIIAGLANILAVPFREGPATGVLFLIPPFTIKYMIDNWPKLRRPVKRVTTPIATIALVILAFTFIPSLSGSSKAKAGESARTTETRR